MWEWGGRGALSTPPPPLLPPLLPPPPPHLLLLHPSICRCGEADSFRLSCYASVSDSARVRERARALSQTLVGVLSFEPAF